MHCRDLRKENEMPNTTRRMPDQRMAPQHMMQGSVLAYIVHCSSVARSKRCVALPIRPVSACCVRSLVE